VNFSPELILSGRPAEQLRERYWTNAWLRTSLA
jgi:hypothetical protein